MDERLKRAAELGNIDALYALIQDDANLFEGIDRMKFVDTPLHIAAAAGHSDFAMEMINLNPSFARKLNQNGLSPIHLALQNQQNELVIDLVSIDRDVLRVKGREGYTPLHVAARDGNIPLLSHFLDHCPHCILDLTIRKETALHIAAQNNRLDALEIILRWILSRHNFEYSTNQARRIINSQDKDGNTVLHIAAANNQHQMIKVLIKSKKVDRNKINGRGLTALDILQQHTPVDLASVKILCSPEYSVWRFVELSRFGKTLARDIMEMKPETSNALLVVLSLVLATTYQALLSPPAGALQVQAASKEHNVWKFFFMKPADRFINFYLTNGLAFILAAIGTFLLLGTIAKSFGVFMLPLYFFMIVSYFTAQEIIAPSTLHDQFVSWYTAIWIGFVYCFSMFRFKR